MEPSEEREDILNHCPVCGEFCENIKHRRALDMTFLLAAASWRELRLVGCPHCVKRALNRNLLKNILTSNVLWPVATLLPYFVSRAGLNTPGRSAAWEKLVDQSVEQERMIAAETAPLPVDAPALEFKAASHTPGAPYRPINGRFGGKMLIGVFLWALFAVPALSLGYAYACRTVHGDMARFFMILLYLGLNGGILYLLAQKLDCRSRTGMRLAALAIGIWTVYCSWVAIIWVATSQHALILSPKRVVRGCIRSAEANPGRNLGWIWSAEALLVGLAPLAICWGAAARKPFCVRCQKKYEVLFRLPPLHPGDIKFLKNELQAGRFDCLMDLPLRLGTQSLLAEVLHCPECADDYVLSIKMKTENPGGGSITFNFVPPVYCDAVLLERLQSRRVSG